MGNKLEVLAEFGFSRDPFKSIVMETADSLRIKRLLKMAIESRSMVSVVATWGQGKTTSIDLAFKGIDASLVRLITPDKERVVVSDIEKALILGLSNESCKRTKEVRARQIRRIIGEAQREKPIILILEEAHRMHGQTLRALKTFREMEWRGQCPLFTVVMIGQFDPMRSKRGVDEVRLRTDTVTMKGITQSEVKEYITSTVGKHFDADAVEAISRLAEARNFLTLQEMLIELMGKALSYGRKHVTCLEVFEVYGGGLKEVMKKAHLSYGDIERETGLSKTAISMACNDKQGTQTEDTFKGAREAIVSVLKNKVTPGRTLKVVE
jgi:type II secretory pathway predicted ATPase ExeA